MNESEPEIWKSHPDIAGIEVSTLGRVRTLDRVVSSEKGTRFTRGRVLKQYDNGRGYLNVSIPIDGKRSMKRVNRLVAQAFIPNPDNLPEVNHKSCIRDDNRVGNLEWCSHSYNQKYRAKYGVPYTGAPGLPLYAVNLKTLEVSRFKSQHEASRELGANQSSINAVIKGRLNQTHGYWFTNADGNDIEIDKDKLNDIVDGMRFREGVFAVNLNTSEVSWFQSQAKASRGLGIFQQNINAVVKGRLKQTGGYWFTNADEKANNSIERKLHDIEKSELKVK